MSPGFLASLEGDASPAFGKDREWGRKRFSFAEYEAPMREQGGLDWGWGLGRRVG